MLWRGRFASTSASICMFELVSFELRDETIIRMNDFPPRFYGGVGILIG